MNNFILSSEMILRPLFCLEDTQKYGFIDI